MNGFIPYHKYDILNQDLYVADLGKMNKKPL